MHRTFALAGLALALFIPARGSAQTCYGLPFAESSITDPWGCGAACGRSTPHRGTDFGVGCGNAIHAIASGVVIANEHSGCLGWVVAVQHPDGVTSGYSHMPSASPLPVGTAVSRGDVIGTVGQAGTCAFGCHLHLTLGAATNSWWTGTTIDPVAYIHAHEAGSTCDEGGGLVLQQSAIYAEPTTTDVNGDNRADLCARASDGLHCYPAIDGGWGPSWAPIPWTDAGTWIDTDHYASIRMGDVDGDGLADACIRSNDAFHCALSNGEGFEPMTIWREGMSDAAGWNAERYWTTIRLADVDGDGRDDLCARDSAGFGCWLSDGTTFATRIEGPRWSDAAGFTLAHYYGTLRMGDVNGDGMADVCIRGAGGVGCALSDGTGFPTDVTGPVWPDASGYNQAQFWTTIRMADVNGDDLDDLCIRTSIDYRCFFSTGAGFDANVTVAELSNASGWGDRTNYATLRVGDVNGDGAEDICARANAQVVCWLWNGTGFDAINGPEWSDASGWAASGAYYDTLRLGDVDGDGRADLCARAGDGVHCHLGDGFTDVLATGPFSDASGWSATPAYWSTILLAGRCEASTETCNARDDDCDGQVDEDDVCVDAAVVPEDASARDDGGRGSRADAGPTRPGSSVTAGCSCRATGARTSSLGWVPLAAVLAWLFSRRRRAVI